MTDMYVVASTGKLCNLASAADRRASRDDWLVASYFSQGRIHYSAQQESLVPSAATMARTRLERADAHIWFSRQRVTMSDWIGFRQVAHKVDLVCVGLQEMEMGGSSLISAGAKEMFAKDLQEKGNDVANWCAAPTSRDVCVRSSYTEQRFVSFKLLGAFVVDWDANTRANAFLALSLQTWHYGLVPSLRTSARMQGVLEQV